MEPQLNENLLFFQKQLSDADRIELNLFNVVSNNR
jgi:hypothetical protein